MPGDVVHGHERLVVGEGEGLGELHAHEQRPIRPGPGVTATASRLERDAGLREGRRTTGTMFST